MKIGTIIAATCAALAFSIVGALFGFLWLAKAGKAEDAIAIAGADCDAT
jgi:hypothetical protein